MLGSDLHGPSACLQDNWKYASVIGMILYLGQNFPDIMFYVHQCTFFTHSTKHSHELSVIRVVKYLKGTADEGFILKTTSKVLSCDYYVDADFVGLFNSEDPEDTICVCFFTGSDKGPSSPSSEREEISYVYSSPKSKSLS